MTDQQGGPLSGIPEVTSAQATEAGPPEPPEAPVVEPPLPLEIPAPAPPPSPEAPPAELPPPAPVEIPATPVPAPPSEPQAADTAAPEAPAADNAPAESAPAEEPVEQAVDAESPDDPDLAALQLELSAEEPVEPEATPETDAVSDAAGSDAAAADTAAPEGEVAQAAAELEAAAATEAASAEAAEPASEEAAAISEASAAIPWWPFLVYLGAWVVVLGAAVYLMLQAPGGTPVWELQLYQALMLAGIALTVMGPLLVLAVWLVVWIRAEKTVRRGLFTSALWRGAVATLAGVLLWMGTLMLVDYLRIGRLL